MQSHSHTTTHAHTFTHTHILFYSESKGKETQGKSNECELYLNKVVIKVKINRTWVVKGDQLSFHWLFASRDRCLEESDNVSC